MDYRDLVINHTGEMIERLLTEILSKEAVDVRFEFEDNDQWSLVTVHMYENDQEISLRLRSGNSYELYFGYYDDEDEFHEIMKTLSEDETKGIPIALQKVMTKVLSDERGMRVPGNFLMAR